MVRRRFVISRPEVIEAQVSSDGTRKWLLRTPTTAHDLEMVFIPTPPRHFVRIEPGGCTLNCTFCHTGTMRLVRNLEPSENVGQVMLARERLKRMAVAAEGADADQHRHDGHGEQLYNFDNVRDALKIVMDGDGLGLSKRRITLSTSGVVPMRPALAPDRVNLRSRCLGVEGCSRRNRAPESQVRIEQLLEACAAYPGANNARRITFEYVMLKDKNDSDEDARELVRLIRKYKLPAKVNLIPFNPWPGAVYECSLPERIRAFSNIIFEAGISAPVRTPRGRDIDAACGQLKTASERSCARKRVRRMALIGRLIGSCSSAAASPSSPPMGKAATYAPAAARR